MGEVYGHVEMHHALDGPALDNDSLKADDACSVFSGLHSTLNRTTIIALPPGSNSHDGSRTLTPRPFCKVGRTRVLRSGVC